LRAKDVYYASPQSLNRLTCAIVPRVVPHQ
jgi:hypothetical protein